MINIRKFSRTEHTNPGQYMPAMSAQGSPLYLIQIPRCRVDNYDLGIAQFLADPLQAELMRKSLTERYGTTANEMFETLDATRELYLLRKKICEA
jgi:hypothetical protein